MPLEADISVFITGFIGAIIGAVIAINAVPIITGAIVTANVSGPEGALLGMTGFIVIAGILMYLVRVFLK